MSLTRRALELRDNYLFTTDVVLLLCSASWEINPTDDQIEQSIIEAIGNPEVSVIWNGIGNDIKLTYRVAVDSNSEINKLVLKKQSDYIAVFTPLIPIKYTIGQEIIINGNSSSD